MQRNITYSSTDTDIETVADIAKENLQSQAFVHSALLNLGIKDYKSLKAKNSRYNFIEDAESNRQLKKILAEKGGDVFDKKTIIRIMDDLNDSPKEKEELETLIRVLEYALSEINKEYKRKFEN